MEEKELERRKAILKSWLFRLLSEVELASTLKAKVTERGSKTILEIDMTG